MCGYILAVLGAIMHYMQYLIMMKAWLYATISAETATGFRNAVK